MHIHFKAQKTTMIRRHPIAPMTQTCKFSFSNQVFGLSHYKLSCRFWKTSCSVSRLMSWSCWRSSCRSWSICPLQAMLDLLPWVLTGVPLQGGDIQLREAWVTSELLTSDKSIFTIRTISSWIGGVQWNRGGSRSGVAFSMIWLHPLRQQFQGSFWRGDTSIPSSSS